MYTFYIIYIYIHIFYTCSQIHIYKLNFTRLLLCARHRIRSFTRVILFNLHSTPYEVASIIFLTFHISKPRFIEVKCTTHVSGGDWILTKLSDYTAGTFNCHTALPWCLCDHRLRIGKMSNNLCSLH